MSENFEYNYHINKLENSIDKVLRFHSRSFAILLRLTSFLQDFKFEMLVDLCVLTFVFCIFTNNHY